MLFQVMCLGSVLATVVISSTAAQSPAAPLIPQAYLGFWAKNMADCSHRELRPDGSVIIGSARITSFERWVRVTAARLTENGIVVEGTAPEKYPGSSIQPTLFRPDRPRSDQLMIGSHRFVRCP